MGRSKREKSTSSNKTMVYNWYVIKTLNIGLGISKYTCFVDGNGYLRWKNDGRLCHRDIAFNHFYKNGSYKHKFSDYIVHHKDEHKFNNNPDNLEIILRETHELDQQNVIHENGKKYIKIAPADIRKKESPNAIGFGGKIEGCRVWYPKSQLILRNKYYYVTEWMFNKKKKYEVASSSHPTIMLSTLETSIVW